MDVSFFEDKAWEDEQVHAKIVVSITEDEMKDALSQGEAFTAHLHDSRYDVDFVCVVMGRRTGSSLLDLRKTRLIET